MIMFYSSHVDQYTTESWFGLCIIANIGVIKGFVRVYAITFVGPVTVSFVDTTEIIVSYLADFIFFGTMPCLLQMFGSTCIIIACVGVLLEDNFVKNLAPSIQKIC